MELEGIRGIASLAVVAHHYIFAFFPLLAYGFSQPQHMRYEDNIYGTPLTLAYAGTFAVAIFFVLSGFVLTIGFFQTGDESIIKNHAAKRYLRLMIPALVATMLCLILIKLGVSSQVQQAADISHSSWLANTWNVSTGFFSALYSGTIEIFMDEGSVYNNVLWTMKTEFIGSFIVFIFALVAGKMRHRWIIYAWLTVMTLNTWFLTFVIGMALADLYAHGHLKTSRKKWMPGLFLVVGLLLGSYPHSHAEYTKYSFLKLELFNNFHIEDKIFYLTIAAALVIVSVLIGHRIKSWLQRPAVGILGKYTFSLYLIHLPVLYSFTVGVFLLSYDNLGYNLSVLTAFILTVPILFVMTISFERYVDNPSIVLARRFSTFLNGSQSIKMKRSIMHQFKKIIKYKTKRVKRFNEVIE